VEVLTWQPVHKAFHCSMSPEQQAHPCVSQPNQQSEAIFDFFPEGVIHKSLSKINWRLNKRGWYSGNAYICSHFRPRPFIKGLASCWYRTVDVFNIPFSNISNHFSRARVISWKCFPCDHKKLKIRSITWFCNWDKLTSFHFFTSTQSMILVNTLVVGVQISVGRV